MNIYRFGEVRKSRRLWGISLAVLMAAAFGAGCKPPPDIRDASLDDMPPQAKQTESPATMAFSAGVPVATGIVKTAPIPTIARGNPFALTPTEAAFEKQQTAAYLATNLAPFPMIYSAPPENLTPPEVEPQPYRRLAGILIGDSITALIDMGSGHVEEIYPGEIIPGTQWMVTSIDSEKAVLTRVGSNRLPHEIVVRLETAPANESPQTNNGGGLGGGPQGFGNPGGGPGYGIPPGGNGPPGGGNDVNP